MKNLLTKILFVSLLPSTVIMSTTQKNLSQRQKMVLENCWVTIGKHGNNNGRNWKTIVTETGAVVVSIAGFFVMLLECLPNSCDDGSGRLIEEQKSPYQMIPSGITILTTGIVAVPAVSEIVLGPVVGSTGRIGEISMALVGLLEGRSMVTRSLTHFVSRDTNGMIVALKDMVTEVVEEGYEVKGGVMATAKVGAGMLAGAVVGATVGVAAGKVEKKVGATMRKQLSHVYYEFVPKTEKESSNECASRKIKKMYGLNFRQK